MNKQECRWCEYFVPRASVCVETRAGISGGMPLKRRANDFCSHFTEWASSDAIKALQTEDRMRANPALSRK